MQKKIYIIGGAQTDFERNWTKEGKNMIALLKEAVEDGFKDAGFTFDEMVALFQLYGFTLENKGATSGSRIKFYNEADQNAYIMHKPHPSNIIKGYMMRDILNYLIKNDYIK